MSREKVSATVITLNEEKNLPRLLASLDFVDEIVVIDSGSTDATESLCRAYSQVVFFREKWRGFGAQKNLAASRARGPWIFSVDADEEVSGELRASILSILECSRGQLYEVNRLTYMGQTPVWHGGWFPDWMIRFYRKGEASFTNPLLHERIPGKGEKLEGLLHHYSFEGLIHQGRKNLRYARLAAEDVRRRRERCLFVKMLFRPMVKFFECYLVKGGFLDGRLGFVIGVNAAYGIFLRYALVLTGKRREDGPQHHGGEEM